MDDGAMDAATSTWRVSGAAMVDGRRDLVEGCRDGCAQIGSESRTNLGGSTILKNGKALFSSQKILQNFSDSPSHRIFRHMHEVLNINKNKN